MERPVNATRPFGNAVPLRCGFLRFPQPAPGVLKKKTALAKAGEYLAKEAKEELALLMRLSIEQIYNINSPHVTYKEEKFIWTWDKEQSDDMQSFFKNEVKGMCRHTYEALNSKDANLGPNSKEAIGVCTRTECEMLKVEDQLMKYLKASLTPEERHRRYMRFIEIFPVKKEIVLYDPAYSKLNQGQLVTGGITKKTIRYIGNSNGSIYNVFTIQVNADSKLEAVKNAFRPLALTGQRGSVRRMFILHYVAHTDADTLNEWFKAITDSLRGNHYNDWNAQIEHAYPVNFKPKNKQQIREKDFVLKKGITDFEVYRDYRTLNDAGKNEEVVAKIPSTLSLEQLFEYMVQTKNTAAANQVFDRYIFGAVNPEKGADEVTDVQVLVNPLNKDGSVLKYREDEQTMLVRAIASAKLEKLPGIVTSISDMIRSFIDRQPPSSELVRSFAMEKSYYVKYPEGEELKREVDEKNPVMKEFTVVWTPVSKISGVKDQMRKVTSKSACLDQVVLRVERNSAAKEIEFSLGESEKKKFSMQTYQRLLLEKPSAARQFARDVELSADEMNDQNTIWKKKEHEIAFKQEQVVAKLVKGTRDEALLNMLRFANFLISERFQSSHKAGVFLEICRALEETMGDCKNIILVRASYILLTRLMMVGVYDRSSFKIRSVVVNKATDTFAKIVQSIAAIDHDIFGLKVLEEAMKCADTVVNNSDSCISTVNLDLVESLGSVLRSFHANVRPGLKPKVGELDTHLSQLEERWFFGYSVLNNEKREKLLTKLELLLDQYYASTEESAKKDLLREIIGIRVPYVREISENNKYSRVWDTASYDPLQKVFRIGKDEGVKVLLSKFKSITVSIPAKHSGFMYVDTSRYINSAVAVPAPLKPTIEPPSSALSICIEASNSELNPEGKAVGGILAMIEAVNGAENPTQSMVTVRVAASAERLFDKDIALKRPKLAAAWSKSVLEGIADGINGYYARSVQGIEGGVARAHRVEKMLPLMPAERYQRIFSS